MTKDLDQIKAELIAALGEALREANTLSDAEGDGYVVAFADDLTPFRTDGARIAMRGRELYIARRAVALDVARELSRKGARVNVLVVALPVADWAKRRAVQVRELIAKL